MNRPTRAALTQACPNCGKVHDIGVFVSGQKITCACGIRFEVVRTDVSSIRAVTTSPDRPGAHALKSEPVSLSGLDATVSPSGGDRPRAAHETSIHHVPELPGYKLVELLGRGGMGEVWRAHQVSLGRMVAVKVLPEKLAGDKEFVARFEKEATALAALSHPNIVQIIDRGQAGAYVFFAMELVAGSDLRRELNKGRLEAREALRIGAQVARAIDYAHEQKIVHRDLKPENVLLDARGHVKIADFGLAGMKDSEHNIALTATSVAMGTVNYMAPEQRRDAKNVDHRADLYSLGVLLYEMLTGELPIGRFKLPTEKVPGLDPRIDDLVGQLLETEREARPERAGVVADQLEELLPASAVGSAAPSKPGSGARVSVPPPAAQPGQGWKWGMAVLAVLAVVVVTAKLWPRRGGTAQTPVVRPSAPPAWYGDSEDEVFSTFDESGTQLSLDFNPSTEEAGEELNLHTGMWALAGGALTAVQYGDPIEIDDSPKVLPRAYVAHRYYSADDYEAQVNVTLEQLGDDFPALAPDAQRFAELSFRIKDLQVSVFAIPNVGMRLMWRYFTPDGTEVVGNSAQDTAAMVEDEMKVPGGTVTMRLSLKKQKNGLVNVEASANGQRFARKVMPGLSGQVGKIAMGCRNLKCRFERLIVRGLPKERPVLKGVPQDPTSD